MIKKKPNSKNRLLFLGIYSVSVQSNGRRDVKMEEGIKVEYGPICISLVQF